MIDNYTKAVLTVIAAALVVLVAQNFRLAPATAQIISDEAERRPIDWAKVLQEDREAAAMRLSLAKAERECGASSRQPCHVQVSGACGSLGNPCYVEILPR